MWVLTIAGGIILAAILLPIVVVVGTALLSMFHYQFQDHPGGALFTVLAVIVLAALLTGN